MTGAHMSGTQFSVHPRTKTMIAPLLLGGIYAVGVLAFIFLWAGMQSIPTFEGFETYGLLYAALCMAGAMSNFEVLQGRRWGVWGQVVVWAATAAANLFLMRPIGADAGIALLVVAFWSFNVYRHWHELR